VISKDLFPLGSCWQQEHQQARWVQMILGNSQAAEAAACCQPVCGMGAPATSHLLSLVAAPSLIVISKLL
jgi:hypothetical protein